MRDQVAAPGAREATALLSRGQVRIPMDSIRRATDLFRKLNPFGWMEYCHPLESQGSKLSKCNLFEEEIKVV